MPVEWRYAYSASSPSYNAQSEANDWEGFHDNWLPVLGKLVAQTGPVGQELGKMTFNRVSSEDSRLIEGMQDQWYAVQRARMVGSASRRSAWVFLRYDPSTQAGTVLHVRDAADDKFADAARDRAFRRD